MHVSGHPRIDELVDLYKVVKPKALIPVHGEPYHMQAHMELAYSIGIKDVQIVDDGQVVRLCPGPVAIVDEIPSGRLYKDGRLLLPEEDTALPERRRLQNSGIVSIAFAVTRKGELESDIEIAFLGVPQTGLSGDNMHDVIEDAVLSTFRSLPKPRRRDRDSLNEALVRAVRAAVDQEWGKKPQCQVHIVSI